MGEALLRHHGGTSFEVFSAGTEPKGINPLTVRTLEEAGLPTAGLSSKSVQQFLGESFDYVITVCDQARQSCPVFPGSHESLHWGYEDPAAATGTDEERMRVFRSVFTQMGQRIGQFIIVARRQRAAQTAV
jgi:arsenate reductase